MLHAQQNVLGNDHLHCCRCPRVHDTSHKRPMVSMAIQGIEMPPNDKTQRALCRMNAEPGAGCIARLVRFRAFYLSIDHRHTPDITLMSGQTPAIIEREAHFRIEIERLRIVRAHAILEATTKIDIPAVIPHVGISRLVIPVCLLYEPVRPRNVIEHSTNVVVVLVRTPGSISSAPRCFFSKSIGHHMFCALVGHGIRKRRNSRTPPLVIRVP